MGLRGALRKALVISAVLAAYELFIKPAYYDWVLARTGEPPSFGDVMLGYFACIIAGFLIERVFFRGE